MVTCLDGHALARQGRAGAALGWQRLPLLSPVPVIGLMLLAKPVAALGLRFGPPETFALTFFALTLVTGLVGASPAKGIAAAAFGMLLGMVGLDPMSSEERFTWRAPPRRWPLIHKRVGWPLRGGRSPGKRGARSAYRALSGTYFEPPADGQRLARLAGALWRGTVIGFLVVYSLAQERRLRRCSRTP